MSKLEIFFSGARHEQRKGYYSSVFCRAYTKSTYTCK